MRLDDWLKQRGVSEAAFGRQIGVKQQSVNRYRKHENIPDRDIMARIVDATGGEVLPNDFYGLPTSPQDDQPEAAA